MGVEAISVADYFRPVSWYSRVEKFRLFDDLGLQGCHGVLPPKHSLLMLYYTVEAKS